MYRKLDTPVLPHIYCQRACGRLAVEAWKSSVRLTLCIVIACGFIFTIHLLFIVTSLLKYLHFFNHSSLLDRVLLIPVQGRNTRSVDECWDYNFSKLLPGVSSVIGQIIYIGQWISTPDGTNFRKECGEIVRAAFGEKGDGSRMSKMWSAGLLVARKVIVFNVLLNLCSSSMLNSHPEKPCQFLDEISRQGQCCLSKADADKIGRYLSLSYNKKSCQLSH